jgi:hypothetical protein
MIFARWAQGRPWLHWSISLPVGDLGSSLFTTGLLGVGLGYVDSRDGEERAAQRLHRVIQAEAPAIRDAVIDGFAFQPDDLARVANPETLDQVITNSLGLRLGDNQFASEIYTDVRDQVVHAPERWHDARVSIRLSADRGTGKTRAPLFVTTVDVEYTVIPHFSTRRFAAASDRAQYRELAQDPETTAWYVSPRMGVDPDREEAFELLAFTVNGESRKISRTVRKDGQVYSVGLGRQHLEAGQPVAVAYTYRTLTLQSGHLLHVDLEQPSRGVEVTLDYGDTPIDLVTTLDYIASSQQARIRRSPKDVPEKTISVQFDGWVFPRSGVAFVWTLHDKASEPTVDKEA